MGHLYEKTITVPITAAGTADEFYGCVASPGRWRIKAVRFAPATASAANGTNYATVDVLTNDGAGGAYASAVTPITTATVALAVDTPRSFTLLTTAAGRAAQHVTTNAMIKVGITHAGTGAVVHGAIELTLEKVP